MNKSFFNKLLRSKNKQIIIDSLYNKFILFFNLNNKNINEIDIIDFAKLTEDFILKFIFKKNSENIYEKINKKKIYFQDKKDFINSFKNIGYFKKKNTNK